MIVKQYSNLRDEYLERSVRREKFTVATGEVIQTRFELVQAGSQVVGVIRVGIADIPETISVKVALRWVGDLRAVVAKRATNC